MPAVVETTPFETIIGLSLGSGKLSFILKAALTRYGTSVITGSYGHAREISKGCGSTEMANRHMTIVIVDQLDITFSISFRL